MQNEHFSIPLLVNDLRRLWSLQVSSQITLNLPERLKHGSHFFINLAVIQAGYFSLFAVDEGGQVQSLIDEQYIEPKSITFPEPNDYDGLISEVVNLQDLFTQDYYVAALCEKSDYNRFASEIATKQYSHTTNNYLFGQVIQSYQDCQLSTQVLVTYR